MSNELKRIKELYGENFAHLCRQLFPTILESEGILLKILTNSFNPSKFLYDDIMAQSQKESFRDLIFSMKLRYDEILEESQIENFQGLIFSLGEIKKHEKTMTDKTPAELLSEAGYDLYECNTEEEIQSFKKYYKKGEELCTFNGGRLDSDFVFFAVKKDVNNIKREDFARPKRQDLYGTSVISIQFQRGENNQLSIKNRYNHHVDKPDSTFANNLDNIIEGLTYSFENYYKLSVMYNKEKFELNNYVLANDGKHYRFNSEIDRVYYCANNIIIRGNEITRLDPCKYLLIDYFIIDLQNKTITMEKNGDDFTDSFLGSVSDIDKLTILNTNYGKEITITFKDKEKKNTVIKINKTNGIIGVHDSNVEYGDKNYLKLCNGLTELDAPNMKATGDDFLFNSENLESINLPSTETIGCNNLFYNRMLRKITLKSAVSIGKCFLYNNEIISEIEMPNVKTIGSDFIPQTNGIVEVYFESLIRAGNNFLRCSKSLKTVIMPVVEEVWDYFAAENKVIERIYMPLLKKAGRFFLNYNLMLKEIDLLSLEELGASSFFHNRVMERANLSKLKTMGYNCFGLNKIISDQIYQQIYKNYIVEDQSDTSQLYSSHV